MKDTRMSKILTERTRRAEDSAFGGSNTARRSEPRPNGNSERSGGIDLDAARASLYDDTLSRKAKSPWRSVTLIVVVLLAAAGLVAFFAGRSAETKPLISLPDMAQSDTAKAETSSPRSPDAIDATAPDVSAAGQSAEAPSAKPEASRAEGDRTPPGGSRASSSRAQVESPQEAEAKTAPADAAPARHPQSVSAKPSSPPAKPKPVQADTEIASNTAPTPPTDSPRPSADSRSSDQIVGSEQAADRAESSDGSDETEDGLVRRGSDDYQQLLQGSVVAAKLAGGQISTISFQDWRVVQQTNTETWIDLIGRWNSSGDEVHFIWSVNRQSGSIRALSEAARNLEHSDS